MATPGALVIFRKQLGDVLMLQPALEHLSRRVGSVAIHARGDFADLLSLMPGEIRLADASIFPKAAEAYCLEARPAALLYAARALGARRHLLLSRDIAPWWQRLIFDEYTVLPGSQLYRAELYQRLFGFADQPFQPPRLNPPPADWRPAGLPAAYRVLHPSAAWQRKTWAAEKWADTLCQLDDSLPWLITSGPTEWEIALAGDIAQRCRPGQVINLAGQTSLMDAMALIAGARGLVSNDSGLMHVAAAFGVQQVAIFGSSSPLHTPPLNERATVLWLKTQADYQPPLDCAPCFERECPLGHTRCLNDISASQVLSYL